MSANTAPIFTKVPNVGIVTGMTAGNNNPDLTAGTSYLAFTSGAGTNPPGTNGSFVKSVVAKAAPGNSTVATVLRIWLNNGGSTGVAANSMLIGEVGIPITTTSASQAQAEFEYVLNRAIPSGYKIYLTLGTAPGGSGAIDAVVYGGDY